MGTHLVAHSLPFHPAPRPLFASHQFEIAVDPHNTYVMDFHVITYLAYMAISLGLTWWVGRTLFRNGQVFLDEVFGEDKLLSRSVNKLLLVGFYLINLGFMVYALKVNGNIENAVALIEILSEQIGKIVLCLGALHFLNLWVFFSLRRRHRRETVPPAYQPMPPLD